MESTGASVDLLEDEDHIYPVIFTSITVIFAMALLSKFLTHEFRFGFRSVLSLVVLFIGEPLCHFFMRGPEGVTVFGIGCIVLYSILPASHLPTEDKAVLITGCDSGFGHALAKKLDSLGIKVFAGCLFSEGPGAIQLRNMCSRRLKVIQLDLTRSDQIASALNEVKNELSSTERLWGLVNNAGVCYTAELEITSEAIFRKMININLMGTINMTKAFLPLIRASKGRIVNISSVTGQVPVPSFGAYGVTQQAIEAYTDVLRLEMRKWQVGVSIIQPSGFFTDSFHDSKIDERSEETWRTIDAETQETYGKAYHDHLNKNLKSLVSRYFSSDLSPVCNCIVSALFSRRPHHRYPVGFATGSVLSLYPHLPIWITDRISTGLGFSSCNVLPVMLDTVRAAE